MSYAYNPVNATNVIFVYLHQRYQRLLVATLAGPILLVRIGVNFHIIYAIVNVTNL